MKIDPKITLKELASDIGGEIHGNGELSITNVATLADAGPSSIAFFSNRKYKHEYLATLAGAVIIGKEDLSSLRPAASLVVVDSPYLAFAKVATKFYKSLTYPSGIDERAAVDSSAQIDPTATVMPFAYIGPRVKVGARAVVHAHCAILDDVVIGADSLLYPGVVVREGCSLGERTIVQPGAIVGGDGFGFAFDREGMRHFKVPQMGNVRISEDVEIGANSCIDRGTLGDTVVGKGTKLDNLVQIAHNVEVGPLCLLAGCSAVAGSAKLGTGVVLGGQVGVIGHLKIGDGAKFAAKSGAAGDIPGGVTMGGWPAIEQKDWLRQQAALRQLPELIKEVRLLRKEMESLSGSVAEEGHGAARN